MRRWRRSVRLRLGSEFFSSVLQPLACSENQTRPKSPRGRTTTGVSAVVAGAAFVPHITARRRRHVPSGAKRFAEQIKPNFLCREAHTGCLVGDCSLDIRNRPPLPAKKNAAAPQRQHLQRAPADAEREELARAMPRALEERSPGISEEERGARRRRGADDGAGRDDGGLRAFRWRARRAAGGERRHQARGGGRPINARTETAAAALAEEHHDVVVLEDGLPRDQKDGRARPLRRAAARAAPLYCYVEGAAAEGAVQGRGGLPTPTPSARSRRTSARAWGPHHSRSRPRARRRRSRRCPSPRRPAVRCRRPASSRRARRAEPASEPPGAAPVVEPEPEPEPPAVPVPEPAPPRATRGPPEPRRRRTCRPSSAGAGA